MHHDVFNGDADGICALHQLRLAEPLDATLVTGLKREIDLVRRVDARPGDTVSVFDVSLSVNRDEMDEALNVFEHCITLAEKETGML